MDFQIEKTSLDAVKPLRDLFLSESSFQFVYNKCHAAGWADVYLFSMNEKQIGYGSVWGKDKREDRDTIFDFFLTSPSRKSAGLFFAEFIRLSKARFVECQTNDELLAQMLFEFTGNINAEAILFEDSFETTFNIHGTRFLKNKLTNGDIEYTLEWDGEVVATGGYVWNYNFPYIDLYYEVKEGHRKKGFGTLITQELKKEAYLLGRVPAARCNVKNLASHNTLIKAGLRVCGYILIGEIVPR
jgi:RimJ/RimL family protein N-acetyltransferase